MKKKVYNDHVTKYESKKGSVMIDSNTNEIRINLNDGKKKNNPDNVVLKRKCVVVNDTKTGVIRAICDSFHIEINAHTNEATVTVF